MKHFFLISNQLKDPNFRAARRITEYIRGQGGTCAYLTLDGFQDGYRKELLEAIPGDTECILVLGGDGTLIKAARDTGELSIPLIGVNLGKLGYLCELEEDTVYPAIDQILSGRFMVEERMMLTGVLLRDGEEILRGFALNDIVLHRSGTLRVVSYTVTVNGQHLSSYTADGIIAATPTGSTAYSLSAGGPIVDPKAPAILLTPINSHNLNNRSIVLGESAVIEIEVTPERWDENTEILLSLDGAGETRLLPGDLVRIQRSEQVARILKLGKRSFLQILQRKLESYGP